MKYILVAACLCLFTMPYAQTPYEKLRPKLGEKTCTVPPSEDECRRSISIIEEWMLENPASVETTTYDDLRTYYYVLSAKDTANRTGYLHKSVEYCLKYAEAADTKQKHWGYWNAAVGYFFLSDCNNAMKYLRLCVKSPGAKKRYRDSATEKGIKKMCKGGVSGK